MTTTASKILDKINGLKNIEMEEGVLGNLFSKKEDLNHLMTSKGYHHTSTDLHPTDDKYHSSTYTHKSGNSSITIIPKAQKFIHTKIKNPNTHNKDAGFHLQTITATGEGHLRKIKKFKDNKRLI